MEAVNGVSDADKGIPTAPSPLTGCYLLIVVGEPHSQEHKDIILRRIAKGLLSWDASDCYVDLEKELAIITQQSPEGEDARYGERLIQFASENLVTEILIHPAISTLSQCMKNLLSSFTRHRHIIHSGYTYAANGSWILQDGTFSLADFSEAFQEIEVQRILRAYDNSISLDIHCSPEGDWTRLPKESLTKNCKLRVNPDDVLSSGSSSIVSFLSYISPFLIPTDIETLLESSDVVGNIRFSHPTLYVFPGGQGDAALFGINGFNMLVDGGFARKSCFWDFVRHLDRLDAVLLTRLNNSNINGISSILRRKKFNTVYPQIGHFFCNIQERKSLLSPDGDKDKDPLLINLLEEGQELFNNLRQLNLQPQPCYRDVEPINLYHKVGHGTLDMYVISPARDSKEVREFLQKWNSNDQKLFSNQRIGKDFLFPIQNLISICALLIWQPANANHNITRILFPGSTPQHKIFEGLDKLKQLECMKYPSCTAKTITPAVIKSKYQKSEKILQDHKEFKIKDKLIQNDSKNKMENKISEEIVKNGHTNGISTDHIIPTRTIRKHDSTESEKSGPKSIENKKIDDKKDVVDKAGEAKTRGKVDQKLKADPKSLKKSRSIERKPKPAADKKPSPTTPKKTIDTKLNGDAHRFRAKTSPSSTPAKSTKEANNRKVVESKYKVAAKRDISKPEKKEVKDRKPISRKATESSPSRKVFESSPIRKPSELHKVESRKAKIEKEGTTDSSTVSTPSAADADISMKKELSKLTPEELEQYKARELAELKEEQEVVNEIEAVFRKSESKKSGDSDLRKIKSISVDDKTEGEEYLIIEKEVIEQDSLDEKETKDGENQKHLRDSEESEKQRKLSNDAPIEKIQLGEKSDENIVHLTDKTPPTADIANVAQSKEFSKDISATSPEEKLDGSGGKKICERDMDEENRENNILESQPDEKYSTPIESGATTAPTLPEDERIPLDEIKEDNADQIIVEKYVKEDTKEKEIPAVQVPSISTECKGKLPHIVGIRLDKQTPIRDIVKTPDEVADLPMHEVVDSDNYEQYQTSTDANKLEENKHLNITKTIIRPKEHKESLNGLSDKVPHDEVEVVDDKEEIVSTEKLATVKQDVKPEESSRDQEELETDKKEVVTETLEENLIQTSVEESEKDNDNEKDIIELEKVENLGLNVKSNLQKTDEIKKEVPKTIQADESKAKIEEKHDTDEENKLLVDQDTQGEATITEKPTTERDDEKELIESTVESTKPEIEKDETAKLILESLKEIPSEAVLKEAKETTLETKVDVIKIETVVQEKLEEEKSAKEIDTKKEKEDTEKQLTESDAKKEKEDTEKQLTESDTKKEREDTEKQLTESDTKKEREDTEKQVTESDTKKEKEDTEKQLTESEVKTKEPTDKNLDEEQNLVSELIVKASTEVKTEEIVERVVEHTVEDVLESKTTKEIIIAEEKEHKIEEIAPEKVSEIIVNGIEQKGMDKNDIESEIVEVVKSKIEETSSKSETQHKITEVVMDPSEDIFNKDKVETLKEDHKIEQSTKELLDQNIVKDIDSLTHTEKITTEIPSQVVEDDNKSQAIETKEGVDKDIKVISDITATLDKEFENDKIDLDDVKESKIIEKTQEKLLESTKESNDLTTKSKETETHTEKITTEITAQLVEDDNETQSNETKEIVENEPSKLTSQTTEDTQPKTPTIEIKDVDSKETDTTTEIQVETENESKPEEQNVVPISKIEEELKENEKDLVQDKPTHITEAKDSDSSVKPTTEILESSTVHSEESATKPEVKTADQNIVQSLTDTKIEEKTSSTSPSNLKDDAEEEKVSKIDIDKIDTEKLTHDVTSVIKTEVKTADQNIVQSLTDTKIEEKTSSTSPSNLKDDAEEEEVSKIDIDKLDTEKLTHDDQLKQPEIDSKPAVHKTIEEKCIDKPSEDKESKLDIGKLEDSKSIDLNETASKYDTVPKVEDIKEKIDEVEKQSATASTEIDIKKTEKEIKDSEGTTNVVKLTEVISHEIISELNAISEIDEHIHIDSENENIISDTAKDSLVKIETKEGKENLEAEKIDSSKASHEDEKKTITDDTISDIRVEDKLAILIPTEVKSDERKNILEEVEIIKPALDELKISLDTIQSTETILQTNLQEKPSVDPKQLEDIKHDDKVVISDLKQDVSNNISALETSLETEKAKVPIDEQIIKKIDEKLIEIEPVGTEKPQVSSDAPSEDLQKEALKSGLSEKDEKETSKPTEKFTQEIVEETKLNVNKIITELDKTDKVDLQKDEESISKIELKKDIVKSEQEIDESVDKYLINEEVIQQKQGDLDNKIEKKLEPEIEAVKIILDDKTNIKPTESEKQETVKLSEQLEDDLELSKGESILQERSDSVCTIKSVEDDALSKLESLNKAEIDVLDKMELGRKSPKEREQDVAIIVASVAEVLKSDAPLEEFEGKIPLEVAPFSSYPLRETHITTVDSPICDKDISSTFKSYPESDPVSAFLTEERKIAPIHTDYDTPKTQESKASSLIKDSAELIEATSKIISGIKQTSNGNDFHGVESIIDPILPSIVEKPLEETVVSKQESALDTSQVIEPVHVDEEHKTKEAASDMKQDDSANEKKKESEVVEDSLLKQDLTSSIVVLSTQDVTDLSKELTIELEKDIDSKHVVIDSTIKSETSSRKSTPELIVKDTLEVNGVSVSGKSTPEIKDTTPSNKSPMLSRASTPSIVINEDNSDIDGKVIEPYMESDVEIAKELKCTEESTKKSKDEEKIDLDVKSSDKIESDLHEKEGTSSTPKDLPVKENVIENVFDITKSFIDNEKSSHCDKIKNDFQIAQQSIELGEGIENIIKSTSSDLKDKEVSPKSINPELEIHRSSVPDISQTEKSDKLKDFSTEKTTPPTDPTTPILKTPPQILADHDLTDKKESKDVINVKTTEIRSSTPTSDDCDISSGQVSRVHTTEDDYEKELSDEEDLPGSPLSAMSQVAHSTSSQYDIEDSVKGVPPIDPMSTSFYGALPDDSIDLSKETKTFHNLEDTDLDFNKALIEHRQTRGEDLIPSGSPSHVYELTTAKYSSGKLKEIPEPSKSEAVATPSESLMTASFIGSQLPSDSNDDPIASWGKPLGLPSPAPLNDNKGTPKKERKVVSNVIAKNKLNEDKKNADSKYDKKGKKVVPVYMDLTYVPHHGNSHYSYVDFFKKVRARYYVFSGIEPSKEVYNALLEAKQTWDDKELEVTIISTYDTDVLGYWVAENEDLLTKCKIDLSPSASRCTINLQDHETSCSAYRLEFS